MAVKLWSNRIEQFCDSTGVPRSGAKLFTYVGGSVNTKQTTYTESTGTTPNTNPIVLDSSGKIPQPIWLTTGVSYKFVLAPSTDTDPPTSPIDTLDVITGINDSSASQSEWISGPTPTFVSATSFTLVGDQTTNFAKSRRVKATVTAGTVYGTITASAFGAVTTVTVALDSGNLDSGLSAISYGIVAAANPSISADEIYRKGTAIASAATTDIWGIAGDFVHVTGATGPITSFGTAPYAGAQRTIIFDSTPTITHNATSLILPGGANIVAAAGDRAIVRADTAANMIVIDYAKASGLSPRATQPTRQVLTSGSGTYTTPTNATRINVRLWGAGGGGAGGTTNGTAGASTTFSTLTASGGAANGGAAGTGTNGDINLTGAIGGAASATQGMSGGTGGGAQMNGAAGPGGQPNTGGGQAGPVNSGGGGGGGGGTAAAGVGAAGGSGAGYVEKLLTAPSATYSYGVGAKGTGGTASASIGPGGDGGSGLIIVDEYYN